MVIFFILCKLSLQEDLSLALQDLSDDPITVTDWQVSRKGILSSYSSLIQQCNQNLLKLTPYPNIYQKTFDIPHLEFDQITIEMDVYFIHFSQSFLRIKIDSKIIFQQTFSTEILQQNNVCGSVDSQYTLSQKFYSSNNQINLVIFYTASSPDSYIGIRNLNIYTNGYKLSNGCTMELPFLQDGDCVQFCTNQNPYLGGEDMLVCQSDDSGISQLLNSYETTQTDFWQFTGSNPTVDQQQYLTVDGYLTYKNLYNNIMYSVLFSSALTCSQQCYYITQNIDETYLLQITFVLYIFNEWNDGSQIGLYIQGDTIYANDMVRIFKIQGKYQCTTGSEFHFTNVTGTEGIIRARRTLITFQGKFYSNAVKIGFSQSISGTGSYGFGNIYVYQSQYDPNIVSSGIYGIPYQCVQNYYAFNGYCVQNCPPYSYQDEINNNCTDLKQQQSTIFQQNYRQSNRIGQYIIKEFYNNNFNQDTINSIFQLVPPSYNNYQNGQPFSFIGNKKILGGYNSWGYGSYGIFINLPIHNQIRIYFKLYLIDDWQDGDCFKITVDSSQQQIFNKDNPAQQLQGHSTLDQQINVEELLVHTSQQFKIIFYCSIQQKNSSLASCGISDLFILYDVYIDVYCNQTNNYFSYFTNNCEQCIDSDCFLYPANYYSNSLSEKALFGCQIRNQNTSLCQTCNTPSYQIKVPDDICECANKFIISDYQCTPCHYSCDTCFGTSQNECLTCDSSRQQVGRKCECYPNYYDSYPSQTCASIINQQQCNYTCQTCFASNYHHCRTCPDNSFRTLNAYNSCVCDPQYMDVGSAICQLIICDPTCLTCFGMLQSNCLTCQTNFRLNNGYCICDGHFNNVLNSNICSQNNLNCNQFQCQASSLQGYLDCDPSLYRYLNILNSSYQQCDCFDGYYDYQGLCVLCGESCLTCLNTATQCLSCDASTNRQFNINKCECIVGYNDKLAPGQNCVLNYVGCHYSCTECFGPDENQCLTCNESRVLTDITCACMLTKYENFITETCEPCNPTCLACNGYTINNCLSCDPSLFRVLSQNQCLCQVGFFELQGICNKCHHSCLSCSSSGPQNCSDCNLFNLRLFDNNQCKCTFGYVDVGNQLCEACPDDCGDCDSLLHCITCKISSHILNEQGHCDCPYGYEKDVNEQCVDCQSIQGWNLISCQYRNSDDGVWTYGEYCDDGNRMPRDGCTQFIIDKGFQCDNILLQPSICYQCPTHCQNCYQKKEIIQCQSCVDNYFKKDNLCYQCYDQNCQICNSYQQCVKCFFDIKPKNGQCLICEQGFEYKDRQCKSICGDGIHTLEEQCDDHNIYSNDGCNQYCQIEPGFICNPECKLEETVILAKLLQQGNQTNNIQIEILYYEFDINQMNVKIEYFNFNEDYKFKTNIINQNKFEIQFTFTKPIKQFNIIHIYLPIKQQKRLLKYLTREIQFTPIEADYYNTQEQNQRQTISMAQTQFYQSLAYVGPMTLILGGTSFFLQILDIISWINNFYYININYPGNVQIFFEKSNWGLIINLPQIYEFQSNHNNQIPQRFQDKGIDGLILNNIQQIVLICIALMISIFVTLNVTKFIKWYQNRNKHLRSLLQSDLVWIQQPQMIKSQLPQVLQLPQQNNQQEQNNSLLLKLLFQLQLFYENRYVIIIQTMNTSILDIVLAIEINLKYINYFNDSILLINYLTCILFTILSLIFLYILYNIVTAHGTIKKLKAFRNLSNQLFEGLKSDKTSRLYGFQAIFQKTLFIISVVIYYETPLVQTLFCSSILLGLLLISIYQFPYSTRKDILSQFIPDISLASILVLCSLLAADEQINYFTYQQRYNVGWSMLSIISLSITIQFIFIIREAYEQILVKLKWIKSIIL